MNQLTKVREVLEYYAFIGFDKGAKARDALNALDEMKPWPSLSECVDWHTEYIMEHGGGDLNMLAAFTMYLRERVKS